MSQDPVSKQGPDGIPVVTVVGPYPSSTTWDSHNTYLQNSDLKYSLNLIRKCILCHICVNALITVVTHWLGYQSC